MRTIKKRLLAFMLVLVMAVPYVFAACGKKPDDGTEPPDTNPITVTVSFEKNGGEGLASLRSVTVGELYGALPASLAKTGYTFAGWWSDTEANGWGLEVTAATAVTKKTDHTLYAKWAAVGMTVTFNAAGGAVSPETANVNYDGLYTLPAPTRGGYTFGGWWTAANGAGTQVTETTKVSQTGNHELFAKWTANVYNVAFNLGSGGWTDAPVTNKKATYNAAYGALPGTAEVERENYIFGGWFTESTLQNKVYSVTTVTYAAANGTTHTLYAKWIPLSEVVEISFVTYSTDVLSPLYVEEGEPVGTLPVLEKTGWMFGGWWTGAGGAGTQVTALTTATASMNAYAKWTAKQTALTLNINYGEPPATTTVTAVFDSAMPNVTASGFTNPVIRTGYNFGGFWSEASGTGTRYYNADMTSAQAWDKENSAFTLYAKWTLKTTGITLDAGAGTGGTATVTATYGAAMPAAAAPTRSGWFFGGYYDGAGGTGVKYYNFDMTSAKNWDKEDEDFTLHAKWIETLDFSDASHAGYFTSFENSSVVQATLNKVNRGGGSGDDWLSATVNPTSPAAPVTAVIQLDYALTAGDFVMVDLDVVYTGSNPLVTATGNATEANSVQFALYGLSTSNSEVWGGTARYSSSGHFSGVTPGAAWPAGGAKSAFYTVPSGVAKLRILARANQSVDFSKLTYYISNVKIIPAGKQYEVSFEKNGGAGTAAAKNVTFNTAYGALPVLTNSDTNVVFGGWYAKNGTGGDWGAVVTSTTLMTAGKDHTLYARWLSKSEVQSYEVTFERNGSTDTAAPMDVYVGFPYGTLPAINKSGNDFKGWWTLNGVSTGNWGSQVTASTIVELSGDQVLYARWFDKTRTSWDFSNPNDRDYFNSVGTNTITFNTLNRGGGAGDNWLAGIINATTLANSAYTALIKLDYTVAAGDVVAFDFDLLYTGANPLIAATGNALEVNSIQFGLYGYNASGTEVWTIARYTSTAGNFSGVTPGAAWPTGGGTTAYTVPTNVVGIGILVRANQSVDFSQLTVYIGDVKTVDTNSVDFSNPDSVSYFGYYLSSNGTPAIFNTVNRGGGASDNWLAVTINPSAPTSTVHVYFELFVKLTSASGSVSFAVDFGYKSALTVASANACSETDSVQLSLYGLNNGGTDTYGGNARYTSTSGHYPGITPGAAWPGVTAASYPVASGIIRLRFMLRVNPSVDFSQLTLYIGNITIVR